MNLLRIIKLFALLGVIICCLFLVSFSINRAIGKLEHGEFGKINSVINHTIDESVMIWGASTALVHFNPIIIQDSVNLGVYNMGIDGTNIDQYYGLLKEYLGYSENCKYLIIVIDIHGGLVDRNAIYNIHLWSSHLKNKNLYESFKDVDISLALKSKWIPFYPLTLHNRTSFSSVKNEWLGQVETTISDNLGFYPNDLPPLDTIELEGTQTNFAIHKTEFVPINQRSLEKVRKACLLATAKGIKPIIVIPPCYTKGLEKLSYTGIFLDSIRSLEDQNAVIFNYLDLDINSDPKLFYNNTHMNYKGANLLSSQLGFDLRQIIQSDQLD